MPAGTGRKRLCNVRPCSASRRSAISRCSAMTARPVRAALLCAGLAVLPAVALAAGSPAPPAAAVPVSPSALPGWADDDQAAALAAFLRSCARPAPAAEAAGGPAVGVDPQNLAAACAAARALPAPADRGAARRFFESRFDAVFPPAPESGFLTGYFEPVLAGSRVRSARYPVPLHALPADLVALGGDDRPAGLDAALTAARRQDDGSLAAYPDRAAIAAGALDGQGLELLFVESPVEAFFAQVQGSLTVRLEDGSTERLGYAGRNGYPYTAIGRILIARGAISREEMTADRLKAWLESHPDEAPAIMAANRSYVFFRRLGTGEPGAGPPGTAGVALTPGRSLAIDGTLHLLGTPMWIMAGNADAGQGDAPLNRLVVAQDTGSAIRGAGRGDLFIGSGAAAGLVAGRLRHPMQLAVLVPRGEPRP